MSGEKKNPETKMDQRARPDAALLETLVYLTEFPAAITGSFDPEFFEIALGSVGHGGCGITRNISRSKSADHKLAPQFVAVMKH